MVRTNRQEINQNHAHTHKKQPIWIQRRNPHIDAITKIGQYVEQADRDSEILLMGPSKAFGAISGALLWATIYKKRLSVETIKHIRRGHQWGKLVPKYKGKYGELAENNIGVFQRSAISALIFIIYGRRDGRQRCAEPKIKYANQDSAARPQGQARQILWGTIKAQDKTNGPLQEQLIIRTVKICRTKKKGRKTTKQDS